MAFVLSRGVWTLVRSESGAVAADAYASPPTEADIPQSERIYTSGAQGIWVYWSATGLGGSDVIDLAVYAFNPVAGIYVAADELVRTNVPPHMMRFFDLQKVDQLAVVVTSVSVPGAPTDLRIWATPGL